MRRFSALPNVESLADADMPQAQTLLWRAVIAPRDIPQDRFLKVVDATAAIYRTGRARRNLQRWTVDIERRSLRNMQHTFKSLGMQKTANGTNPYGAEYRAAVRRDTKKFIADLKKLAS